MRRQVERAQVERSSQIGVAFRLFALIDEQPSRISELMLAALMLKVALCPSIKPVRLRFSVSMPMPASIASRGVAGRVSRPTTCVKPSTAPGQAPNIAWASSVRPAPTRPNRPRISPSRKAKLTRSTRTLSGSSGIAQRQVLHAQDPLRVCRGLSRRRTFRITTDHCANDFAIFALHLIEASYDPAIAHDDDAVGDTLDLIEPMGNVETRDSLAQTLRIWE